MPRRWLGKLDGEPLVLTCFFLSTCGQAIIRPASTYRTLELGGGVREVGLIVAAFSAVAVVAAIPVGRGIDRSGSRRGMVIGSSLLIVAGIGCAFSASLWMLAGAMAFGGVSNVFVMLSAQAFAASNKEPDTRQRQFARNSTANSVGQIAGPLLLGSSMAMSHGHLDSSVMVAFLVVSGTGLLGLSIGSLMSTFGRTPSSPSERLSLRLLSDIAGRRGMQLALAAGIAIMVAQDILVAYLPVIGQHAGLAPAVVGVLLSTRGIASLLSRLIMMQMLRKVGMRVVLVLTLLLPSVALGSLAWTNHVWEFASAVVVFGFFIGIGTPLTASWVAHLSPPDRRATALGIRVMGNRFGQTVIPIGLGAVGASVGVGVVVLAPAVALLACGCWVMGGGELGSEGR